MVWYRSERARQFVMDANDGIIGTAGVLQGFAGAGASSSTLLVASVSALVAGAVAQFGGQYSEVAAERDAERDLVRHELTELSTDPDVERAEIAAHFESRGVPPELSRAVAHELHAHDPLAAQLEQEHGVRELTGPFEPLVAGLLAAGAFALGSGMPLLMLIVYPALWESWAVFVAVLISLSITSGLIALAAGTRVWRALLRTVGIGVATMLISYLAGSLVF